MAKVYTGRDAQMLLRDPATNTWDVSLKVTSWTFQGNLNLLDITSLNDSTKYYSPGVTSYSGSASLLYYKDDANRNSAGTMLKKLIKPGTAGISADTTTGEKIRLRLRLIDGTDINDIEFLAYVTAASFGASVGDLVTAEINFAATDDLKVVSF